MERREVVSINIPIHCEGCFCFELGSQSTSSQQDPNPDFHGCEPMQSRRMSNPDIPLSATYVPAWSSFVHRVFIMCSLKLSPLNWNNGEMDPE